MRLPRRSPSGRRCWLAASAACSSGGGSRQADDQDRVGRLLRSQAHGRDLRPGPRGRRATRSTATASASAPRQVRQPALESGQIDLDAGVHRLRPRLLRQDRADRRRRPTNRDGAARRSSTARAAGSRSSTITPGAGPERVRRPQGHGRPVQPHQDERPHRRPGPAQVGPADRLRHEPAVRGRARVATASRTRRSSARPSRRATRRWPQALHGKTIDVGELCSTQPDIAQYGFVVLQDDKKTQPAENIAPLVRNDYLAKVDKAAFEKILNDVVGQDDDRRADGARHAGRGRQEGHRGRRQGVPDRERLAQVTHRLHHDEGPGSSGAFAIPGGAPHGRPPGRRRAVTPRVVDNELPSGMRTVTATARKAAPAVLIQSWDGCNPG